MYLYLATEDGFDSVPEPLMKRFGTPALVMQLTLSSERRLARVEVEQVIAGLREHGFFLQMPPQLQPDLYHGNLD